MDEWEEWQTAWQEPAPAEATQTDPTVLLDRVRKHDQKNRRQLFIGALGNVATLGALGFIWYQFPFHAPIGWIGAGLVVLSLLLTFPYFNILAKAPVHSGPGLGGAAYVRSRIEALTRRKSIAKVFIPIYALLLTTGINCVYAELLSTANLVTQLLAHGLTTLTMIGIFLWGLRNYMKKFEKEVSPLITELKQLLSEFS